MLYYSYLLRGKDGSYWLLCPYLPARAICKKMKHWHTKNSLLFPKIIANKVWGIFFQGSSLFHFSYFFNKSEGYWVLLLGNLKSNFKINKRFIKLEKNRGGPK